jgi:hypothetical protein
MQMARSAIVLGRTIQIEADSIDLKKLNHLVICCSTPE